MRKYRDEVRELIKTVAENSHQNAMKQFEKGEMPNGTIDRCKISKDRDAS